MNAHVVGTVSIQGRMARRLLVNATTDADVVRPLLPPAVTPAVVGGDGGRALVGVCLLRVADLRPGRVPAVLGRSFDGLAYRVAVTRPDGVPAVHIVRRETADGLALAVGGRLFPGTHRRVDMDVSTDELRVAAGGHGGPALVVDVIDEPPGPGHASVLGDDEQASVFFSAATMATSPARRAGRHEGLRMEAPPFSVRAVRPRELVLDRLAWALGAPGVGALRFDSAFLVRDVPVRFTPVAVA